jgi:hypothetical protein
VDTGTDEERRSAEGTVYSSDEEEREEAVDNGDSAAVNGTVIFAAEKQIGR